MNTHLQPLNEPTLPSIHPEVIPLRPDTTASLTTDHCDFCQQNAAIHLRGQRFLGTKTVVHYGLCHLCCQRISAQPLSLNAHPAIRTIKHSNRQAFWTTVLTQAMSRQSSRSPQPTLASSRRTKTRRSTPSRDKPQGAKRAKIRVLGEY